MPIRFDGGQDDGQDSELGNSVGAAPLLALFGFVVLLWKYPRLTVFLLLLGAFIYLIVNPDVSERVLGINLGAKLDALIESLRK